MNGGGRKNLPVCLLMKVEDKRSYYKPKNGSRSDGSGNRGISSVKSVPKWSDVVTPSNVSHKPAPPVGFAKASSPVGNLRCDGAPASVGPRLVFGAVSGNSNIGVGHPSEELEEQTRRLSEERDVISESSKLDNLGEKKDQASQEKTKINGGFDIFKTAPVFQLKAPLHLKNREKRRENTLSGGPNIKVLRPGMLHLRHYISVADQVRILQTCRNLGLQGPRGFYQPYGKLNRLMMILGKNWDHQKNMYVDVNPFDGLKPLPIPAEFRKFSDQAIRDSHDHLRKQSVMDVESTLPPLTPDICVVNFYSKSSRLGVHQDKNESKESLRKGLPVVSISIGDSAEFVYGDQGDVDKLEKVVLESGDILIFGGWSRLVFHGVTTIKPDTAPKVLLEETNLRPGRINLTFRQFQ
ncbi:DNA metabolism protein [Lithospermum erythrorhizon]|uniref:DNA metabolism protein n=1 Tax=Lithospermum erythrorhizon TaxID=34254 RepID=A0AAV3NKU5_LITER